jgi:hypothetical protein
MRKLGCALLLVVAIVAFLTRDYWLHFGPIGSDKPMAAGGVVWEPLTPEGATRARRAVESLGTKNGPVFANVHAGDLASYVFVALSKQLTLSAESTQAAVIGDRMYVRSVADIRALGGAKALGPLASFLSDRDTVTFGGSFEIVRPGLAQFRVREIKLRQLAIPSGAIPRLLQQIEHGTRPPGIAEDGLPLTVPPYIADVRVARGQVTIYKSVP